ncbi:MAG: sulfonate ABC transporter substrate-binding protein, partial [Acidimicrobiales bacterium]
VTTHLVARPAYLDDHPDVIEGLLGGHLAATDYLNTGGADARRAVNDALEAATGKRLADKVIDAAWPHLSFTVDPIASSLAASARAAEALGLLDKVDLTGIYDLAPLNQLLAQRGGDQTVKGL